GEPGRAFGEGAGHLAHAGDAAPVVVVVAEDEGERQLQLGCEDREQRLERGGLGDVAGDEDQVDLLLGERVAEGREAARGEEVQVDVRRPRETTDRSGERGEHGESIAQAARTSPGKHAWMAPASRVSRSRSAATRASISARRASTICRARVSWSS